MKAAHDVRSMEEPAEEKGSGLWSTAAAIMWYMGDWVARTR